MEPKEDIVFVRINNESLELVKGYYEPVPIGA